MNITFIDSGSSVVNRAGAKHIKIAVSFFAFALVFLFILVHVAGYSIANMINGLDIADKRAMLAMNFAGGSVADHFWYSYTQQFIWAPLMLIVVITLLKLHPGCTRDKLIFVVSLALVIVAFDQLASGVIKPLVCRPRPSHDAALAPLLHYVNGYHGGAHGFVSSHAAVNVGIATMLCCIFKDRLTRITLVLYASLMCYSRIYLGVHYPGDIICGGFIGWLVAYASFKYLGSRMRMFSTTRRPVFILLAYYIGVLIVMI